MRVLQLVSAVEQVAKHLREQIQRGTLNGLMPGEVRLTAELGVNHKTVESALRLLEAEGVLISRGPGKRRGIVPTESPACQGLRVAILGGEGTDHTLGLMVEIVHRLEEAGHAAFHAQKPMAELGMDVRRITRMVENTKADAWVVAAGPRAVLEWFAGREQPAFALFGRRRGLPIAGVGPDKPAAYAAATRALIELGHRRIVLLARKRRTLPEPGASERAFLAELASHGIIPGPYHMPDWEESIEGFHARLESLFQVSPPTALIVDEVPLFAAAQQFLADRGLRVPGDVSLVSTDYDPTFAWCRSSVAHIRWDIRPVVRRLVNWAMNVGSGRNDRRQTLTPAQFVAGGTIGPAHQHRREIESTHAR